MHSIRADWRHAQLSQCLSNLLLRVSLLEGGVGGGGNAEAGTRVGVSGGRGEGAGGARAVSWGGVWSGVRGRRVAVGRQIRVGRGLQVGVGVGVGVGAGVGVGVATMNQFFCSVQCAAAGAVLHTNARKEC